MIREVQTQSVALTADEWQALEQKRRNMTPQQELQLSRWKAAQQQMHSHPATARACERKMRQLVGPLLAVRDWEPNQVARTTALSWYHEERPPAPTAFDYSNDFDVMRSIMGAIY